MKIKRSELNQLIQEGIWDSLKYYVGKMGSLEKGGKLTGKKDYVEKAKKQFDNTLDKAANVQVKNLVNQIEKEFEEFPNQKDQWEFVNATTAIAAFYDSLKSAVDKYNAGEKEGAMAPEVANGLVEALREYVRILLDSKLADVYKHFTEEQESDEELFEAIFTNWEKKAKELEDEDKEKEPEAEKEPEKVLKTGEESGTIKSLKSNLLPGALGLLGAGFNAAHFALAKMYLGPSGGEIAEDIYKMTKEKAPDEEWIEYTKGKLGDTVKLDSEGGYLRMVTPPGGDPANFAANIDYWAEKTGQDPSAIIRMVAGQNPNPDFPLEISDDAGQVLYDYSKQFPGKKIWGAIGNSTTPPSQHFQDWVKNNTGLSDQYYQALSKPGSMSGSPKAAATLLGVGKGGLTIPGVAKTVATVLKKQGAAIAKKQIIKTGAGGMAAAAAPKAGAILAGSGILGTLGIGLAAAGAAVKLLRMKGLKSSRAQILNDLEKTLKDFESTGILAPTEPEKEEPTKPEAATEEPGKPEGPSGEEIAQDLEDNPPAKPPAPNVTRLALARLDDDGVKVYIGTRRNKDQRAKEQDLMQAAEEEGVVGRNTNPTTDTLDQEFRKLKKIPDTIKAQYDDIVKRMKGKSAKQPEPYFVVDKSVISDIRKRLSRLKGNAKKTEISNDAIEKYVEGALKNYIEQDGKINLRDTTKLITDFIGSKISTAEKAILQNALVSYGLVKPSERMPGLAAAAKASRSKKRKETDKKAEPAQNLQEHKSTLDRWKTLSGILKG